MIRNHGEFVQNEIVGGFLGWELGDQKLCRGVLEGVGLW